MNEASYIVGFDPFRPEESMERIYQSAQALLHGERDLTANCANIASLIYHSYPQLSWCGWYFTDYNELVLGPFAGKPACTRIRFGKGVCGTAAKERRVINVPYVEEFKGHIACDAETRSELVVPLVGGNNLLGVLDLDSTLPARFRDADVSFFESICRLVLTSSRYD